MRLPEAINPVNKALFRSVPKPDWQGRHHGGRELLRDRSVACRLRGAVKAALDLRRETERTRAERLRLRGAAVLDDLVLVIDIAPDTAFAINVLLYPAEGCLEAVHLEKYTPFFLNFSSCVCPEPVWTSDRFSQENGDKRWRFRTCFASHAQSFVLAAYSHRFSASAMFAVRRNISALLWPSWLARRTWYCAQPSFSLNVSSHLCPEPVLTNGRVFIGRE